MLEAISVPGCDKGIQRIVVISPEWSQFSFWYAFLCVLLLPKWQLVSPLKIKKTDMLPEFCRQASRLGRGEIVEILFKIVV